MRILLHICCAPCAIYPLTELRRLGAEVTGYFYNHNIHPYTEFRLRREALEGYAGQVALPMLWHREYDLEEFLASVAAAPQSRCGYCYRSRLERTARTAAEQGFDCFSSTLLYSRYQNHEEIRRAAEDAGARYGVTFHYDDYRRGWQEGIDRSKELGLYRQKYCGCIYSEKDRYLRKKK